MGFQSSMDRSLSVNFPSTSMSTINCRDGVQLESPSKITSRSADVRLVGTHREVYEPCDDSFALVDALLAERSKILELQPMLCLEIGCGSGYVITSLAIMLRELGSSTQFYATDINPHAVQTTKSTLEAHGVDTEIVLTDIALGLQKRLARMMDVIVVNPPYVPTPEEEVGCDGITASWAGGENGRSVIDRILPVVNKLLSDKGWLYMVTLAANNPLQICCLMREKGYASRIVVQRSTEEESLHVIKFWRDVEAEHEDHKVHSKSDSWLSHLPMFSFLKGAGSSR